MPPLSAGAAVDDSALELVPARGELVLEVGHEDAEVRVVRARVHLRDEEDPHCVINRDASESSALSPRYLRSVGGGAS